MKNKILLFITTFLVSTMLLPVCLLANDDADPIPYVYSVENSEAAFENPISPTIDANQKTEVPFNHPNLAYEGRIIYNDTTSVLMWSGTSVTIHFDGTEVSAIMRDQDTSNFYNIIVDDKLASKIHLGKEKQTYLLASGLDDGEHTVQLFKRTQWDRGRTSFYGFELGVGGTLLPRIAPKKRKIEFYGNSITCGQDIEDLTYDRYMGKYENNYETYAAVTARHFNAEYRCISKSGIGIMVSWFPLIMPEMYNKLDPTDPTSVWDFSQYTPDVVVINLFQNDSWIVNWPDNPEFKHRFGTTKPDAEATINAYKNFVSSLREVYPDASIICTLGNMDATKEGSPWIDYIKEAVKRLDDDKMFVCFFPFKNTPGHPKVNEHHVMADTLINFIDENIKW